MATSEHLLDPKLRAFVSKAQYIEALHYYRSQFGASRAEAAAAIDLVRAQIQQEREQGFSGKRPAYLTPREPLAPQQPSINRYAPLEEDKEEDDLEEEPGASAEAEDEEDQDDKRDADYDKQNPYAHLPPSPSKRQRAAPKPLLPLAEVDKEEALDEDEELADEESELDEDDDAFDEDDEPEEPEAAEDEETDEPERPAASVSVVSAPVRAPVVEVSAPVAAQVIEPPSAVVISKAQQPVSLPVLLTEASGEDVPEWSRLPAGLRDELVALFRDGLVYDAIRLYWQARGCSLQEAKAHVSFWAQHQR